MSHCTVHQCRINNGGTLAQDGGHIQLMRFRVL